MNTRDRLQLDALMTAPEDLGREVLMGLSGYPKTIPAKYFYDDRGSELFEQICGLPEYYPTRTETAILQACASEIAGITGACELVELGSGSALKTRLLLDAYRDRGYPLHYMPIDISAGILESSSRSLIDDYATLSVRGLVSTYELALASLPQFPPAKRLLCFLGSSLGNLSPDECDVFFAQIAAGLQPGDFFLLGVDLQKPKQILEAAYNDAQHVTADFNLNMLQHLNNRFAGNFDLKQFQHLAIYNEVDCQIEMYLIGLTAQTVSLTFPHMGEPRAFEFAAGEKMLTEISRKFDLDTLSQEICAKGFRQTGVWTDANRWYGLLLFQANPGEL